jgi:putative transposase
MDPIFYVLLAGCRRNALKATGICSSGSVHRRFEEWCETLVFEEFWCIGLMAVATLDGIDWERLAMDGARTKAPRGGGKSANPTDRGKGGVKRCLMTDANGILIAITVDGANRHDMKLVSPTINDLKREKPTPSTEHP